MFDELEDFWGRRIYGPTYEQIFHLFGQPIRLTSNEKAVLAVIAPLQQFYSTAPTLSLEPWQLHIAVRHGQTNSPPAPDNLLDLIQYTGFDKILLLHLGVWGVVQVDLATNRAVAAITPSLAARPDILSRSVLCTVFNNLFEHNGYTMLHATGLVKDNHLLLLLAGHNIGKSTTALRLALAGFRFMSDSQIYIGPGTPLQLTGFPIGRAKLRRDMLPHFPQIESMLQAEAVRQETKYTFNLRLLGSQFVQEAAIVPAGITLYLLSRHNQSQTVIRPAGRAEAEQAARQHGTHWDNPAIWKKHLAQIDRFLDQTTHYHIQIGSDPTHLIQTIANQHEAKQF